MKILITGGNSSMAMALKPELSKFAELITAGRHNCDLIFDVGNIDETYNLPTGIDTIIHTAAHPGSSEPEKIREAENINATGTLRLCELAVKAGVKHFIFISSIYSTLTENSPNYSIYSLSKKHAEELAELYCHKVDLPLTILRLGPVYGNNDRLIIHHPFLYSITTKAKNNLDIELHGTRDALRNFIHMDDVVNIIVRLVNQKHLGTWPCLFPENFSYSRIALAALAAFNSEKKVYFNKDKPDIPDNIFEQDNSLYELIGYYPKTSIEEGMKKLALWQKQSK